MSKLNIPKPKSDIWLTPKPLFYALDKMYDFTLDPCACRGYELKPSITNYYDNGLNKEWFGRVFCNPPYESRKIEKWIRKGKYELEQKNIDLVCYLLPVKTDQDWFHYLFKAYEECRVSRSLVSRYRVLWFSNTTKHIGFIKGRLTFRKPNGRSQNAPFESMLAILKAWW